ncbi:MAG: serine/threonine protein kinase, partial [Calditrichaeota bacterium]|nr:serine/threonine protein kinase [Calditrichota bacterium]MCB0316225.1 serine/threonine protein kinase [Calditrichota bacterium]
MKNQIGKTISHYHILEKLGEGGMGVVYKAEDTRLKRPVALKFLPAHLTRDKEANQRFIHEAQAASALDHPNVCTIFQVDETEDGQVFIAMGYYQGETLKQRIRSGPLPVETALNIAIQIADGLVHAHEKGIVHRDVNPSNIIIQENGTVKIIDFGLTKLLSGERITETGTVKGTVNYMSPEQAKGAAVDHRTDIWAL